MTLLLLAVALGVACVVASLRAYRACKVIQSTPLVEDDPLEQSLLEREHNLKLNLAKRSSEVYGRVALWGGFALGFWALISFLSASGATVDVGQGPPSGRMYDIRTLAIIRTIAIFGAAIVAWIVCGDLHRRIGLLAEGWRKDVNARRLRQGVDQIRGTG